MPKSLRLLGHALFLLSLALATAWAATALWVQIAAPLVWLLWAALAATSLAALSLHWRSPKASWAVVAVASLAIAGWYLSLQPRQDRDWSPDVAHNVTGEVNGNIASLHNIRNFRWTSASAAEERWEDRSYNLDEITSLDMFTSTWGNPNIAHLLVSFGFKDGQHLVYSVEIRKEQGEVFSSVGGFFRQFEIALIAATEEDIVRVRTNQRGEDVQLFPIKLDPEKRRALFLTYLAYGNQLAAKPQFYNTVTANCASTVYALVKSIEPQMPLDSRLLFSGQLPEYIDELGGLEGEMPMAERRAKAAISAKAKAIPEGADFSSLIRTN
jgi:hypothetical protein